ncbi:unnamed protein product [Colias eurytheme]|nr:unnamed protein product [Colias eurytheme]
MLPNVVGEGDVISQQSPNGSVQLYFIPVFRRDRGLSFPQYPTFPSNNPISWPVAPEAWLVRRISSPVLPSFIQEQFTNTNDPFLKSYYATKGILDISPQNGYYQKFHNDNVTSTTDIHYFYPKLRKSNFKYSTGVQVDIPPRVHKYTQYETQRFPGQSPSLKVLRLNKNKFVRHYTADTTESAMSIDEKHDKQPLHKHKRGKSLKNHTKSTDTHPAKQTCKCNKTDKKITTYSDQACGCIDTDGRETQTIVEMASQSSSKCELSDVNTATSYESCCQVCKHCINDSTTDFCA